MNRTSQNLIDRKGIERKIHIGDTENPAQLIEYNRGRIT